MLEFQVQHVGAAAGTRTVNASVDYTDSEGNKADFPSPSVEVNCDLIVIPETCPQPVELTMDACQDTLEFDAGDLMLNGLGRILQLDVHLKCICPHRRVSLAAVFSQEDETGADEYLGMKVVTVPAHSGPSCRDILVKCIPFVLPEEASACGAASLCRDRPLKVRLMAQYRDVDFRCCGETS